MELKFRLLKANEIDCRISTISDKGLSLLLYKDARVDQNILDETVGPMNWQRMHTRDNANCIVSIWDPDKKMWVSKEDTGTESNTEKEKGLASDSFKRACFNWGIGRELYTAPFIWIPAKDCKITDKNGKKACYDRFRVSAISYDGERCISDLEIVNDSTQRIVFMYKNTAVDAQEAQEQAETQKTDKPTQAELNALNDALKRTNVKLSSMLDYYHIKNIADMTYTQWTDAMKRLADKPDYKPADLDDENLPWN